MTQDTDSMLPTLRQAIQWVWPIVKPSARLGLAAALATALISLFIPNRYTSTARILPAVRQSTSLGGLSALAANAGLSIPDADGPEGAYVDILESRSIREALLETRFRFHDRSWRFGSPKVEEETLYEYLGMANMDKAVVALQDHITVTRDIKTHLLTISVKTTSADLSEAAAQRMVALLNEFVETKERTRGSEKAAFAEARLKEARISLDAAQDEFERFLGSNRNYAISADPSIRLQGSRLEMEYRLRQSLIATLATNREQALLEAKNDLPILNVLDPGNLPIEKSGPARSAMVLVAWLLCTLGNLVVQEWGAVIRWFKGGAQV